MAGIIHTSVPTATTRRRLLAGTLGVFASVAANRAMLAQSGSATPERTIELSGGPERISSLLSMIPEGLVAQNPSDDVVFYYADLQRQLDSLGIPRYDPVTDELPDGFTGAMVVLATASVGYQYRREPDFLSTFGFSALQAEETLSIGTPPNDLTIFRGGLPVDSLAEIWQGSGYVRESSESGADIWTVGREGEVDLTTNVSRYGVGALNNVAILGETVVFGRYFADVESVVELAQQDVGSVADLPGMSTLLATLTEDTVSVIAVTSEFLNLNELMLPEQVAEMEPLFAESEAAAGRVPEPESALFAITAGAQAADFVATGEGTPAPVATAEASASDGGVVQVRLAFGSNDDAATAVAAIDYRWNSWISGRINAPFSDLMTVITAEPIGTVAAVDFREVLNPGVWVDIVLSRDLVPFSWMGDLPDEATPTAVG